MYSPLPLQEYRCACGKLLFKAALFVCAVEIKCRRCGAVKCFERFDAEGFLLVESDAQGRVEDLFFGSQMPVEGLRDYALGRQLSELYPLLREGGLHREALSNAGAEPYHIRDNVVLLRDGVQMPVASYIMPREKGGAAGGYRILNWEKRPPQG